MPITSPVATVLQATRLHCAGANGTLFDLPSLTIPPGLTCVQGGEGRGKTTLLRLLAGELPQQVDSMVLSGIDLHSQEAAYRRTVAWFDPRTEAHDTQSCTAIFNHQSLRYPTWNADLLGELVQVLGLTAHLDKPLYMLSAGSKRKVWLAAAFASGATLTLLDQPFAALDGASVRILLELLADASEHPHRAWVLADYQAPNGIPLTQTIDLGD